MNFATPQALADHLAQTIDDEAFIAKAVRIKFPKWNGGTARSDFTPKEYLPRAPRPEESKRTHYADREYRAVRPSDDWYASEQSDKAFRSMIAIGSGSLLRALHTAHPSIMECLKAQGKGVVQP